MSSIVNKIRTDPHRSKFIFNNPKYQEIGMLLFIKVRNCMIYTSDKRLVGHKGESRRSWRNLLIMPFLFLMIRKYTHFWSPILKRKSFFSLPLSMTFLNFWVARIWEELFPLRLFYFLRSLSTLPLIIVYLRMKWCRYASGLSVIQLVKNQQT